VKAKSRPTKGLREDVQLAKSLHANYKTTWNLCFKDKITGSSTYITIHRMASELAVLKLKCIDWIVVMYRLSNYSY